MVEIIKIDPSEMPDMSRGTNQAEYDAVRALEAGEAIKFPCRWPHKGVRTIRYQCNAILYVRVIGQKARFSLSAKCHEGWVYVHRLSEVNNAKA